MAARLRVTPKPAIVKPKAPPPPKPKFTPKVPTIEIETTPSPKPARLGIDNGIEIDVDLIAIMEKDSRKSEKQKTAEFKDHAQLFRELYDKQKRQLERAEEFSSEIQSAAKKETIQQRIKKLKTDENLSFTKQQKELRETIAKEIQENPDNALALTAYFKEQKTKKGTQYETEKHIADKINTVALYEKLNIKRENENHMIIANKIDDKKLVEITNFPKPSTCTTKIAAADEQPTDLACLLMVKAANDRLRMDPSSPKKFNINNITPASAEAGMRLFLYGKGYGLEPSIDEPSKAAIKAYINAPGSKPLDSLVALYREVIAAENNYAPISKIKIQDKMRALRDSVQKPLSPKPIKPDATTPESKRDKPGPRIH